MKFIDETHKLDNSQMDGTHQEFIDIYNDLKDTSTQSYKNVMIKLYEHTKLHFYSEEEMMVEYNYPRKKEHIDEHNKVLAEMEYFINRSNSKMGQMMLKSYYKEKLPSWFDLHLISMDSDLSSHIKNNS
ncbi:MAG: hemerythrin domain-containing protein [Campylobacterota bacterium]|nr:hemerythrin domain-containing protein [Campylobacterota bacterium]